MFRRAVVPLCVAFALPLAAPAFASLEGDVEFSPLPEVAVAMNETTGSVRNTASCSTTAAKPIVIYDNAGAVLALVYVTAENEDC